MLETRVERVSAWIVLCLLVVLGCEDSGGAGLRTGASKARASSDAGASTDPCPRGRHEGDYDIRTKADAVAIAACADVTGSLNVSGDGLARLSLPELQTVGGALDVKDTKALEQLDFSALTTVGKEVQVEGNAALTSVSLPALESSQMLLLLNNPKFEDYGLGRLSKLSFMTWQGNDALGRIELPKLESVRVFVINQNGSLTAVSFPSLTVVDGDGFIMLRNPMLASLEMPMLKRVAGDTAINDNPMLPSCQIEALVARLDSPVRLTATGNDDSATCP